MHSQGVVWAGEGFYPGGCSRGAAAGAADVLWGAAALACQTSVLLGCTQCACVTACRQGSCCLFVADTLIHPQPFFGTTRPLPTCLQIASPPTCC